MPSRVPEGFEAEAGTISTRELARRYNATEDVVRRWRSEAGIPAPIPRVRTFTRPQVNLDRAVLTSDWHVPYHSQVMVDAVIQEATQRGIQDVLLIGDGIDLPTISRFDARDIDSYVGMEMSAMGDVLYEFGRAGLRVHWSRGNHELRYFKALKHQVDIRDLVKATIGEVDWVVGYDVEELELHSAGETWLLSHPQDYSIIPLRMARTLSEKYSVHVAQGHSHMFSFGHSPSGKQLVDTGGLFDPDKMAYLWRGGATKFPQQQPGFVIIENGVAVMP